MGSRPHLPDSRWFWSMTVNGPMTRADRVATLEEAKAQFQKSWEAWKAWAKLEEVPDTQRDAREGTGMRTQRSGNARSGRDTHVHRACQPMGASWPTKLRVTNGPLCPSRR